MGLNAPLKAKDRLQTARLKHVHRPRSRKANDVIQNGGQNISPLVKRQVIPSLPQLRALPDELDLRNGRDGRQLPFVLLDPLANPIAQPFELGPVHVTIGVCVSNFGELRPVLLQ